MFIAIPFGFLRTYGPKVWRDINRYEDLIADAAVSGRDLESKHEVMHPPSSPSPSTESGLCGSPVRAPGALAPECALPHHEVVPARRREAD